MKVAIMTDSNSGITQSQAKELGIFVIPMPFTINDEPFYEDINLTQEQFYEYLESGAEVLTSQPTLGELKDFWDKALEDYDQIVHIPMSSSLSSSCQTAMIMAEEDEYEGKVFVVNSQRIAATQRCDVYDAIELAKQGKTGAEIHQILTENKLNASIYITVGTLDYLKKGGRLTPAVAALGTLLGLKPVLQIQGEKLDKFSTARTMKKARKIMIDAIKDDIESRGFGDDYSISVCYTTDLDTAMDWKQEVEETFNRKVRFMDPLSLSVSCHIGPGALAILVTKNII
ncbi:MAG: DegV family protein [Erysipelotrichaceae bacterium]|nr:DegV family protein [Erysipelotrichaceae bacterium]